MSSHPLVSIVTPSFNQADYLLATLQSVADQDYPAIEHIVVDGGSTDGTVEILKRFSKDHRLTWTSQADDGQADAIRRGFSVTAGDILAWLNSDDIYLRPDAVSLVVEEFRHGASVVTASGRYINGAGHDAGPIAVRRELLAADVLSRVDSILQPATFFSRTVWNSITIDPMLHYAFDWDLFIQMSRASRITPLDVEIAGYRLHEGSKTVSGGLDRQHELLLIAERYGRATPIVLLMKAQIWLRSRVPSLGPALDRLLSLSNRITRNHGLPC